MIANRYSLFLAKAFYYLYYGAGASLLPFLALYYQSLGFSGRQIGFLSSISPFIMLFGAPFWGGLADATQRHRQVLVLSITGALVSVFLLSTTGSFGLLALVVVVYAFFASPMIPIIDKTTLELLGERRDLYGRQRMWGAIGWGIAGPLIGFLAEKQGLKWPFWGYLVHMSLGLLIAWRLPVSKESIRSRYWSGVRKLLENRAWFLFLVIVFVSGLGSAIITNFLFLYLNELHVSKTLMGMALTIATLSEIPALFFSGWMIRRWGARGVLAISLTAYVLRVYGYSLANAPWQALSLQLLHGLTFAAMWAAGVTYAGQIAPPGLGATAQGLFTSTVFGLSGITGALVGGVLFDLVGGRMMFRWSGTFVFFSLVLLLFAGWRSRRKAREAELIVQ